MNYNEVNIVNTETIMKQLDVNALVAKVIDAKGLTEEKFHALNEDYEYHLGDYSGAEDIKNIIKESYDNDEKFLIVSDPKLDNLFASIIVIRSLAKMKARFEIKYINKDEYMLKGNVIAIHDTLQFILSHWLLLLISVLMCHYHMLIEHCLKELKKSWKISNMLYLNVL